jgi:hypothetical protein
MERTEIEVDRTEIEKLLHDELERARLLYDAEEKNFRRFADFIIHGVVLDDLKGTDTIADA